MAKRLVSLVALLAVVGGTPAFAESLNEALATAYATNPTLDAQRAAIRATDEEIAKALSGWRPTVTISGSGGFETQENTVPGGVKVSSDLNPCSYQ